MYGRDDGKDSQVSMQRTAVFPLLSVETMVT